jgi:16S rRNA (guanine527-N7)-methyltransferase
LKNEIRNSFPYNRFSRMFHVEHPGGAVLVRSGGGEGVSPDLLREILAEAGIPVFPGAVSLLAVHADEMLRWNRSIRLTAITDPVAVAVKHVADSLLLLRFAPFPGRILDFGSGAGYPGVPLALYLPGTRVTLLEASVKKCAFLSRARGMLRLSNVDVVQARAEERKRLPLAPHDHIVTRATASAGEVFSLLSPYLAVGGRFLFMMGPGARVDAPGGLPGTVTRRERFRLPRGMGDREIVEIELVEKE